MRRILFFLLVISLPCHAAIYMQEDENGNIAYSDTPSANSKVLNMPDVESASSEFQVTPELSTSSSTTAEPTSSGDATEPTAVNQYRSFAIVSPKDQENIQNQPTLPVEIKTEPALQKGDKIQVLLDGKLTGNPSESTHIELGQLERGTHVLSAIIVNQKQQVLQQTNPITIYVNRVNVNFKPGNASSSGQVPKKGFMAVLKKLFG